MPTYEYHCHKCNKNFDVFQSISAQAYDVCPQDCCQSEEWGQGAVQRVISGGSGLLFKGSGFYITDYRSNSYKNSLSKEGGAKSSSSSAAT